MKPTNPTLDALLRSRKFYAVDLFTIILVDGTELYYCAGDLDIEYGGHTYSCGGQSGALWGLDGDEEQSTWSVGTASDALVVNIIPRSGTILGLPIKTAIRYGVLDGAMLRQEIAFMPSYGDTTAGLVLMFLGRIAECDIGDMSVTINVNSPMELLDQQSPRNLVTPGCGWTLYDEGCTLLPASFETACVIQAGSTRSLLLVSGPSQISQYFNQGKIIFNTGVNDKLSRAIKSWAKGAGSTGTISIFPPLPQVPTPGDLLKAYPGCNKSPTDVNGCPKFANLANFRGFPDVPVAETAI